MQQSEPTGLKSLVQDDVALVEIYFKMDPKGSITPTFTALLADGSHLVAYAYWTSDEEKAEMLEALKAEYKKRGVTAYTFVSEAWMSHNCIENAVRPSEASDKVEVVIITASNGIETEAVFLEMVRNEEGDVKKLKPFNLAAGGMVGAGGPATELLGKRTLH